MSTPAQAAAPARYASIHDPLPVDEHGFITDPHLWSETFACLVAAQEGRGTLSEEHLAIIYYLREHFLSYGAMPPVHQLCHEQSMHKDRVKQLFGSCRNAWRTAGLPHPGDEALAYMS
jgi:TusE/DsrC/DsvC family sulfur relay protein